MSAPNYESLSFPSPEALAHAAAEQWCSMEFRLQPAERATMLLARQTGRPAEAGTPYAPTVALSAGRIATQFFNAVARLRPRMEDVHFFWADERCVSPDHPESNYRAARELLFEPLAIPPSRIHRIRGEDDPASAAKSASDELALLAAKNPLGLPILDLVFLGMGEDGHVASLFPGAPPQSGIYYPVTGPKPPPRRITLSYGVLIAARDVWVLVSGPAKQAALARSLAPGGDTPLGRLVRGRQNTRIFCDFSLK